MTRTLRPTSNLVVPEHFQLDKKALQSKFFYIYRALYNMSETVFMTKLWACSLIPQIGNDKRLGSVRKGVKEARRFRTQKTAYGYLSIKKVMGLNPYFTVSVPLFSFNKTSRASLDQFLHDYLLGSLYDGQDTKPSAEYVQEISTLQERLKTETGTTANIVISAAQVINNFQGLDARTRAALQSCLEQIRIQTKGNLAVIFADFKITKEEAQQLTSTQWIELRDIDLYPMLLQWVVTGFGSEGLVPFVAFPISRIAATLPKNHATFSRIDEDGISISAKG